MLKSFAASARFGPPLRGFSSTMSTYRFDEFELDLDAGQLRLRGEPVRLERRPFDLLALLVTNPGRLHTREEIIAALWPEKVIIDFDAGLNTLVRKVRHALGDSPEAPRYIETVPARGYRFAAPVTVARTPVIPAPASVPEAAVVATPASAPESCAEHGTIAAALLRRSRPAPRDRCRLLRVACR